ncbi:MAG: hypothetical protein AB1298_03315 [Bacteroidota bacterium]
MMTFRSFPSNKYHKLFLTIFLALIFFNASLYSQTKIKERVGINLSLLSPISSENDTCTITVQITWSARSYEGFIGILYNGWLATSNWVSGGSNSVSATVSSLEGLGFQS